MIAAYVRVIGSCGLARQGGKLLVAAFEARARALGRAGTAPQGEATSLGSQQAAGEHLHAFQTVLQTLVDVVDMVDIQSGMHILKPIHKMHFLTLCLA